MVTTVGPSADTRVALLLCARLGRQGDGATRPLTPSEYDAVLRWLHRRAMRPADLLAGGRRASDADGGPLSPARLRALLDGEGALDRVLATWMNAGLWVVSRGEAAYPARFVERLGRQAPPVLFGAGDPALLRGGGLAIVGSRHADEVALGFARRVARACARQSISVVSGGARGVDSAAMEGALAEGGRVVGVLADSLARKAGSRAYGAAIRDGRLALLSACDPAAGFDVGNAMGRNKYVYALADAGLVVSASLGTGGTWAGAMEALARGTALFARVQEVPPEANVELLAMGARPFPDEPWADLAAILSPPGTAGAGVPGRAGRRPARTLREAGSPLLDDSDGLDGARSAETSTVSQWPVVPDVGATAGVAGRRDGPGSVYDAVLPLLLARLAEPRDIASLAQELAVQKGQLRVWLRRAVLERRVVRVREKGTELYVAW